jgi:acyl-CoA synthetase (AMP-forming)/AMP-acid ligase II
MYTSGSTGNPKGVVVPRSALENHMAWFLDEFEVGPDDRVLQRTTPIFDASVWEFWAPMMSGACLVQLDGEAKRDPAEIAAAVRRHRITVLQVVPSLLRALLDEADFVTADTLRLVFSGGEPLTAALRDEFASTSDALLVNLYGPTEATIDATFRRCERANDGGVPIGRPIAGTGAVVLDEAGEPTPIGVPGRLHLSGAGLAHGYFAQPRLTAERFVPNGFAGLPGDRLYDTGDLARFRTDGQLEYLGRTDRQVKVRGHRVELGEIEQVLEAHSGVLRAAVIAHRDDLLAFVVPSDGLVATRDPNAASRGAPHNALKPNLIESLAGLRPRMVLEIDGSARADGSEAWEKVPGVERHVEVATESEYMGDERFDLVVLHSVSPRHASAAHLAESIESAVARVGPKGHVAIDHVRSLPLLDVFHATAAIAIADDAMSAADLGRHVRDAISSEQDLILDPQFFVDFAATSDVISRCTVLLDGRRDDPVRFCYDVVLHVGPSESSQPPPVQLEWSHDRLTAATLSSHLVTADAGCVVVCDIPDGDLAGPILATGACIDGVRPHAAGELREMMERKHPGLTRAILNDIADECGYALTLMPAPTTAGPGRLDAVFTRAGVDPLVVGMRSADSETPRYNEPSRGLLASLLLPELRADIERTLPDYMAPSQFVVLPELPTRPNGKPDHGALPIPVSRAPSRTATYQAPADALEEQLVDVWREVIGQDEIGVDDDFFVELGGHSLLAARLAGRLRSVLAIDVPLQLVFDSPTVASMAAALRHDGPARDRPGDEAAPVPLGVTRVAWTTDAHGTLSLSDG